MKLHTYFRSSAAFRVRIALALKGLPSEPAYVHMVRGGGEQHSPAYRAINPQGLVPTFTDEGSISSSRLRSASISKRNTPSRRCYRAICVPAPMFAP